MTTPGDLTALALLSHTLGDPTLIGLVGAAEGMELAAHVGEAALSLQTKAGRPVGAFHSR